MNFDDIIGKAKIVAEEVGKKTGEVVEIAKIRLQIANINSELQNSFENLGTIVYEFKKSGVQNDELVDICIEEIESYYAQLAECNLKIDELKKVHKCPECGFPNAQEACFCSRCGAELPKCAAPDDEKQSSAGQDQTAYKTGSEQAGESVDVEYVEIKLKEE